MGTWKLFKNNAPIGIDTMLLLTDGRVMALESGTSKNWYALTPDNTGSYLNGTWAQLDSMKHAKRFFASGVLNDGRVIICGGEYDENSGIFSTPKWSVDCEIYDPVKDEWIIIPSPPGWAKIGDATSVVLPDGKFMIGNPENTQCAIYDPTKTTSPWTIVTGKAITSNEETWILLPDNTVITVQCWGTSADKYVIGRGWQPELNGKFPVGLIDYKQHEIGPAMLLPNGKVIYFGADGTDWSSDGLRRSGKTAIYTMPSSPTGVGTWAPGPDIPAIGGKIMVCCDSPATLLPNGKVLFTVAEYVYGGFGSPTYFCEYDYTTNKIMQAPTPTNNGAHAYEARLMLLPTGEVLYGKLSKDLQLYQPEGSPQATWRPIIYSISTSGPNEFYIDGMMFNGFSQANIYGDDMNPATNYPIIRLTNTATGKVYYARSYRFSTMGVSRVPATVPATITPTHSCNFSPRTVPPGTYNVSVIANGISSSNTKTLTLVGGMTLVWKGSGTDQGIYYSSLDGTAWLTPKQVSGTGTSLVPAIALFANKIYMVWKGAGSDQGIWYNTFDGSTWSAQKQVSGVGTSASPALAVFNGKLYMVWKGANSDQGIWYTTFDGTNWAAQKQISGVGTSGAPALAVYNSRLYMAWKGAGSDNAIWYCYFDGTNWAGQQKAPSATTIVSPSLAVYKGKLYMAWRGSDSDQKVMYASFNGSTWASPQQVGWFIGWGWTSFRPVLASYNGRLYAIWKGSDNDQVMWYSVYDGNGWTAQQGMSPITSSLGGSVIAL